MTNQPDVPGQLLFADEASAWLETIGRIKAENETLTKENENLKRQVSDLRATLEESGNFGGMWCV